jgi:hypothetical protein
VTAAGASTNRAGARVVPFTTTDSKMLSGQSTTARSVVVVPR